MALRFNGIVIAPELDRKHFNLDRYQHGGVVGWWGTLQPKSEWTFNLVPKLVAYVQGLEGKPNLHYYLIGHSAGGQFLARMAAFMPCNAKRIVAANPSTWIFPTRDLPFPFGFGGLPPELSDDEALRSYLAAPLTLYLGTADNKQDEELEQSRKAMKQGDCRLERGRNCYRMAQQLAADKHWICNWRKVEIEGVGHNDRRMLAGKEVAEALFGEAGTQP